MAKMSPIGKIAEAETKKEFAEQLAIYTTLSAQEAMELFPTKVDRDELIALLKIVKDSADDNDRKAKIVERIGEVSGALVKISKKFATGLG